MFLPGLKGSGIQKSVIFGVLAVRYIALPLVGIAVVKGALRFGLVRENPLYEFVLLLQFAVPPAMNIGTLCLAASLYAALSRRHFWRKHALNFKNL